MRPSSPFSSSSAAAAATTSPSVSGNACNSKNGSQGRLTGVLRLLLCLNSLPTHPGDHFKEEEKQPLISDKLLFVEEANYPDDFNTPGVVARLMGLESRPHITEKSPNSIRRSQSIQGSRRQEKSFHEISSCKEVEDDQSFFIISFDNNAGETWQGMKSDMNSGEKKQRKKAISKNNSREIVQEESKENQDANKDNWIDSEKIYSDCEVRDPCNVLENSCQKSHLVYELVESGHKGRARRRRRKRAKSKLTKLGMGCDSKDSCSKSVLDFAEVPPEPDPDSASSGLIRDDYDRKEKWDEVCQLVERETSPSSSPSQSNWIFKEILEESEDIGRYLGLQILDRLLAELLSNLEIPVKSFDLPP